MDGLWLFVSQSEIRTSLARSRVGSQAGCDGRRGASSSSTFSPGPPRRAPTAHAPLAGDAGGESTARLSRLARHEGARRAQGPEFCCATAQRPLRSAAHADHVTLNSRGNPHREPKLHKTNGVHRNESHDFGSHDFGSTIHIHDVALLCARTSNELLMLGITMDDCVASLYRRR